MNGHTWFGFGDLVPHTPGPWWVVDQIPIGGGIDIGPELDGIGPHAQVTFNGGASEANARLISAAPDLLAACKAVDVEAKDIDGNGNVVIPSHVWDLVSVAIAKAEGR